VTLCVAALNDSVGARDPQRDAVRHARSRLSFVLRAWRVGVIAAYPYREVWQSGGCRDHDRG